MRILLASSEVHPYSKTGGLADMVGAMAKALAHAGHQVGVVTPLYGWIWKKFPDLKQLDWHMELPLGEKKIRAEVWTLQPIPGLTVYFVHAPEYFHRNSLYGEQSGDYPDNAERFIFFSKAVVHLARYLPWQPEVVHANDWQTGFVPLLMLNEKMQAGWGTLPRICFTIHNLAYQGIFPGTAFSLSNLPLDYFNLFGVEFYGAVNCLKAAINFTDVITTVSPRYAREITTPEYGCQLDDILRKRQSVLFGVLNGVDYEEWNTTKNPHLKHPYSVGRIAGKAKNKAELQAELGLPVD